MKLVEILLESPWTKVGNHKGVLTRTVDPKDVANSKAAKNARERKRRADDRMLKLNDERLRPIEMEDIPNNDELQQMGDERFGGFGGEIFDRDVLKKTFTSADGVTVAALKLMLAISYEPEDAPNQNHMLFKLHKNPNELKHFDSRKSIPNDIDRERVTDAIPVLLYRDPDSPSQFKLKFGM